MVKKKDPYKVAVLGAGSWGITLADLLNKNSCSVVLWEFDKKGLEKLKKTRRFVSLKSYKIPKEIKITGSITEAVADADLIVVAVPSVAINNVAAALKQANIKKSTIITSTIKGFDFKTLKRPSEILRDHLGNQFHISVLSGPSHAEEVIRKTPTAVVIASINEDVNRVLQGVFSNVYFRVYTSTDIKGVELGGALKNVIAVASGIASGLGLGDNTRAALITRGNAEMKRLGTAMGAKDTTFSGLSGIGDLIVTCFSEHSRNNRFGKYIGQGSSFKEALKKVQTTVEGANTAKICNRLSKKYKIQMPVCIIVYEMLYKGKDPKKACQELMLRPLKSEHKEK